MQYRKIETIFPRKQGWSVRLPPIIGSGLTDGILGSFGGECMSTPLGRPAARSSLEISQPLAIHSEKATETIPPASPPTPESNSAPRPLSEPLQRWLDLSA
jgi:hypothetical protein